MSTPNNDPTVISLRILFVWTFFIWAGVTLAMLIISHDMRTIPKTPIQLIVFGIWVLIAIALQERRWHNSNVASLAILLVVILAFGVEMLGQGS